MPSDTSRPSGWCWSASASTSSVRRCRSGAKQSNCASTRSRKTGGIEVQLVTEYSGAELVGQRLVLRNLGKEPLDLAADREGPAGTIAFAYGRDALRPGETTSAFLVFRKGGLE